MTSGTRNPRRSSRGRQLGVGILVLVGMMGAVGAAGTVGAQTAQTIEANVFVPMAPQRVLDTRLGIGGITGNLSDFSLEVRGQAGVPDQATAVVLNVTAFDSTASSYLAVQPAGEAQNLVSNLNFQPGQTVANLVTVKIGGGGAVRFFNAVGTVGVVADIAGYYVPGSGAAGPQGPQGPQGVAGDMGSTGATGPAGVDGNTVLSGLGAPDINTGFDGDYYLDTDTSTLYGAKTGGSWPQGVSLVGPKGDKGDMGDVGPVGADGAPGLPGADGATGPAGPTGPAGTGSAYLSSANAATMTTVSGGLEGVVAMLPLQGGLASAIRSDDPSVVGGVPGIAQVMPQSVNLSNLYASVTNTSALALIGTTVSLKATLWTRNPGPLGVALATTLTCDLSPALTGVIATGNVSTCSMTGVSVPVAAGTKVWIQFSSTAAGLSLSNTIDASVSAGVLSLPIIG